MPNPVALIGLAVFAGGLSTTLPLPLYVEYAAAEGHGAGALAAAFACYAFTLILTAPLLGPLPDRLGRKRCVLAGLVLTASSTLALALAPGVPMLALARTLQGLGMGCITNAASAWAAELGGGTPEAARRAAGAVAMGTAGSFGMGALLTLVALLAAPELRPPLVFPLHILLCFGLMWPIARLRETLAAPRGSAIRLPVWPRGTLPTTLASIAGWGTTGTVLTAVPAALAAQGMPSAGPWALGLMMVAGAAAQRLMGRIPARRSVTWGLFCLLSGAALVLWGSTHGTLPPLLLGGVLTGIAAYGLVYLGGLAAVAEAAGQDRARATAGYFVVAHFGFSAVPLVVGLCVDAFGAGLALPGFLVWLTAVIAALLWAERRSAPPAAMHRPASRAR